MDEQKYVIVRTQNAGVFAGYLVSNTDTTATLTDSRRLWYWSGAASLSQLAVIGTSKPTQCKFPAPIEGEHTVKDWIEIIPVTDRARKSIAEVPVWQE